MPQYYIFSIVKILWGDEEFDFLINFTQTPINKPKSVKKISKNMINVAKSWYIEDWGWEVVTGGAIGISSLLFL